MGWTICFACRCRVIPPLSKAMNKIHSNYLPRPTSWLISLDKSITESLVAYFKKAASSLETLRVHPIDPELFKLGIKGDLTCLEELLEAAAKFAPKLRRLELGALYYCQGINSVMRALSSLSHLEKLELSWWDLTGVEQLANLRNLQASCPFQDLIVRATAELFL